MAQSTMDDISALLGSDPSGGSAAVVNDAELLAELEALAPADPVPPQQAMPPSRESVVSAPPQPPTTTPRRPLVDAASYGAASPWKRSCAVVTTAIRIITNPTNDNNLARSP